VLVDCLYCDLLSTTWFWLFKRKTNFLTYYYRSKIFIVESGIISSSLNSLRLFLAPAQKRYGVWMLILLLTNSFLDVFGLAALVPIIMVAAEPGGIKGNKYFSAAYSLLGFQSERTFLVVLITALFVFFLLKNIFSTWSSNLQALFTAKIGLLLTNRQMTKYLNFPFWYFNDIGHAELTNSAINIPVGYVNGILRPLLILLSEIAVVIVIIVGIILYKPLLIILLLIILAPTTWLIYRGLRSRSLAIGNRLNELYPFAAGKMHDLFIGNTELKLANKVQHFREEITSSQEEIQYLSAESYLYSLIPIKVIELVAILGVVTIFIYSLFSKDGSSELISLIGLFAAAAYRLMPSVNRMLTAVVQMKQNQYTITNLTAYQEAQYNEAPNPNQLPLTFQNKITFENVGFTFPKETRPALEGISFQINKGEKIGFVGSSGSGKTTLMNLLLRFYIEQKGVISVDDQPLTSQYLRAWYDIVGYVKQDTFLMEASIRDNITLNDKVVDEERLTYALNQASLRSFIDGLPDGDNTLIGERGSKLSGGQRQRLGIARALYKRTQVLVFDEATSALDNQTEREVNEAINSLSSTDITILIIAHRITTLRECDRIYELNSGRLIGEHQYEDLVKQTFE
jgi:ABC-type multidrug transport system fused ATPase/permease subunit